jgi:diguanylate cyclase (GGDEF)-like protein/PAS domain S-box-containing protein
VKLTALPQNGKQRIQQTSASARDITDRNKVPEAILNSENQYRLLFEANPVPMWVFNRETFRFLAVNQAAIRKYGFTEHEFLVMTIRDIRPEGDIPNLLEDIAKRNSGHQETGAWRHCKKNGDILDVEIVCHSLDFHESKAMLVAAFDLTERNLSKVTLQDSENKYRVLFEDAAEANWLMEGNRLEDCNLAALEMFGFATKAEFKHSSDVSPSEQPDGTPSRAAAEQRITAAHLNGKDRFEWSCQRKNGEIFPTEVSLAALSVGGRPMLMVTVRDITERKRAEEALLFRTALMEAQSETTIDGILVVDDSDQIVLVNKQFGRHFGVSESVLSQRDDSKLLNYVIGKIVDPDAFLERVKYLYAHPDAKSRDEFSLKNGKIFDRYSAPLVDPNGRRRGRIWYFRDISERVKAEMAVRQAEEKYRAIFEDSVVGIFQVTPEGRPISINRALAHLYGYDSATDLIAEVQNMAEQLFVDPGQMIELAKLVAKQEIVRGVEVQVYRKDRTKKWVLMNLRAVHDIYNDIGHYEGTVEDVTDRKIAEERVEYLAYYDALTGLPNRAFLKDRLEDAVAGFLQRNEKFALLHLDLDRFKIINDSLGHTLGDFLLKDVAERLSGCTRKQDTVARFGGDGFLILLSDIENVKDVTAAAEKVVNEMARDFPVKSHSLSATCSLGVSVCPEHGIDSETLLKNADAAMYSAKANGGNCFKFFVEDLNIQASEQLMLENGLRGALERDEFFLVYQPQMDLASGEITGLEALIRWQHPELGLVPPDKFIRVAEASGLILPIGEWVLRTACTQAQQWQEAGLLAIPVAVNVSAVQFRQSGFCELIKTVLAETRLPAQFLELELTESLLLSNADMMFSVLQELREMGLKLAIDDFGTGYSSLSYLKKFRVNKLKIDRSFIREVATDSDDAAITTAIINMAKSLKLKVIAEGVENEAQMSFLREHHCDEIQGYYFSKPVRATEISVKLQCLPAQRCALSCAVVSSKVQSNSLFRIQ